MTATVAATGSIPLRAVLDYWIEIWLGFEINTILVATPLCGVVVIKLWQRSLALEYLQRDVDWRTLIFHLLLFAKAGCLYHVGLIERITSPILNLAKGYSASIVMVVMLGISGLLLVALDNVVVVARLVPVVQTLSAQLGTSALWWALLFGGCYGGNLTMVGSTANIVALGELEKKTGHYMTLGYWLKIGLWAFLIPMVIGTVALLIFG